MPLLNIGTGRALMNPPRAAAPAAPSPFIGNASVLANGYSAGNKTFTANGGSNLPACLFVCGFCTDDALDPTTFNIGATALSKVSNDSTGKVQLWAAVYAGGSDTITIGNGNTFDKMCVASGWVTGGGLTASAVSPQSGTYASAVANAGTPFALGSPCVIPASGIGFVAGACLNTALSANNRNWASVESSPAPSDGFASGQARISLACQDTAGSWSPTFWGSTNADPIAYNFAAGLAACAFGP